MKKKKSVFVLVLHDRYFSGISTDRLDHALDTFARFALQGVLQKLDPNGQIPIEDCSLAISRDDKSVTLSISVPPKREKELAAAVNAVYKDLLGEIDRWGIEELAKAGH